jgi:parvulin-like peptidyl-prolyl isomerase
LPSLGLTVVYAEDKIVAIVNGDVITQKDLTDFLNFMRLQLSQQYEGKQLEEKISEVQADILNRLIEDRLILQEAKRAKINVDETRIKSRINEVKRGYPTDVQFQAELKRQGLTQGDIEDKMREQFLMLSIVEQKVRSKVTVKPDEVTEFYEKNKGDFNSGQARELEAISLENSDLARSVAYNLKAGQKLASLASKYPLTVNKLMIKPGDELRKDIEDTVSKLGINEVSEPIKIDDKYYVFRLIDISPARELTLFEAQGKIRSLLFEKKMQESLLRWLNELKKDSYIKIV